MKKKHLDEVVEMPKSKQAFQQIDDYKRFQIDQVIAVMDHPVNDILAFEKRK